MRYDKQLNRHKPDEGIYGDCWSTCIACMLDLPPQGVPHFFDNDASGNQGMALTRGWLKANHGLTVAGFPLAFEAEDVHEVARIVGTQNPRMHYMLMGFSETGVNHVVVCYNTRVIHNPSLDEAQIIGPCDPGGMYWVYFLARA